MVFFISKIYHNITVFKKWTGMIIVLKDISIPIVLFFEPVRHYRIFALLLVNYPITFDDYFPSLIFQDHFLFKNFQLLFFNQRGSGEFEKPGYFLKTAFDFSRTSISRTARTESFVISSL